MAIVEVGYDSGMGWIGTRGSLEGVLDLGPIWKGERQYLLMNV